MGWGRWSGLGLALGGLMTLGGCALPGGGATDSVAVVAPDADGTVPPSRLGTPEERAAEEAAMNRFYANVQTDLIATGRLRLDTTPADAPYGVEDLVRDFERVALYQEYIYVDGRSVASATPAPLRRWNAPVRVGAMTSGSVPARDAAHDRGNVAAFTRRLARLTGLDMATTDDASANFLVLFVNGADRGTFAEQVSRRYPGFAPAVEDALSDISSDTFCVNYAFEDPVDPSVYSAVLVLIRAEHPPLTRLSCVHEEMSQALGLPNDSPGVRPSLFSGDMEFALLTEHDEILLRMLYDPRLRPGMTADEIRPLLPDIARAAIAAEQNEGDATLLAVN